MIRIRTGNSGFRLAILKKATPMKAITSGMHAINKIEFLAPITLGSDFTPATVSPGMSEISPRRRVTMAKSPKNAAEK